MPELFPYGKRHQYPGLKPADQAIWERFLTEFPMAYDSVQYNLNCGEGAQGFSHEDPSMQMMWGKLKARKIDVTAFAGDHVDIIELKPYAGPSALGQVIGYYHLYLGYVDPHADARPVIVTNAMMPDMPYLSARMGVRVIVV
ncbi:MAG: hypothetical protein KGH79_04280 [Patescibacteria group bacterium]|nr:hypothetical protein [Patescibacteria group bacterium]